MLQFFSHSAYTNPNKAEESWQIHNSHTLKSEANEISTAQQSAAVWLLDVSSAV